MQGLVDRCHTEVVCAGEPVEQWACWTCLPRWWRSPAPVEEQVGRYRLLETVRQYASERLLESGSGEKDARTPSGLLRRGGGGRRGVFQGFGASVLAGSSEAENENPACGAGLALVEKETHREASLAWTGALGWFWTKRGYLGEARQRIEAALRAESGAPHHWGSSLTSRERYFPGRLCLVPFVLRDEAGFLCEKRGTVGAAWHSSASRPGVCGSGLPAATYCAQESLLLREPLETAGCLPIRSLFWGLWRGNRPTSRLQRRGWKSRGPTLYRAADDKWESAWRCSTLGALRQCQGFP